MHESTKYILEFIKNCHWITNTNHKSSLNMTKSDYLGFYDWLFRFFCLCFFPHSDAISKQLNIFNVNLTLTNDTWIVAIVKIILFFFSSNFYLRKKILIRMTWSPYSQMIELDVSFNLNEKDFFYSEYSYKSIHKNKMLIGISNN